MDNENRLILTPEELEISDLLDEVSTPAAAGPSSSNLPITTIYSRFNEDVSSDDVSSQASYMGEINDERLPSNMHEYLEDSSEEHENGKSVMPITRPIRNAPEPKLFTTSVINVEIRIPEIEHRNIHITPTIDLSYRKPNVRRVAATCSMLKFAMTVNFPQYIGNDSSTTMFIGEINESNFPPIPLCFKNASELANALRASAIRSSLKLPMTVVFLRRDEKIISTYFFGGSSTAQIVVVDSENLALKEVEEFRPSPETIIEEIHDSQPIYGCVEHLTIELSSCTALEVQCSDIDTDDPDISESEEEELAVATLAEIAPADEKKSRRIRLKSFLLRLERRIIKLGRKLCCCGVSSTNRGTMASKSVWILS